jgi:hypothetical protein
MHETNYENVYVESEDDYKQVWLMMRNIVIFRFYWTYSVNQILADDYLKEWIN